jgi:uncharacterized protein (DUF1810 family)
MAEDRFDLARFVTAQESTFETALAELRSGRKRSHWMWFVFPQLRGLGSSSTARFFCLASLEEARAYLGHPVLGPRLREVTQAVLQLGGRSLREIFGSPDDLKFRSCMTLFALADASPDGAFRDALARCCNGIADEATLRLIREEP